MARPGLGTFDSGRVGLDEEVRRLPEAAEHARRGEQEPARRVLVHVVEGVAGAGDKGLGVAVE